MPSAQESVVKSREPSTLLMTDPIRTWHSPKVEVRQGGIAGSGVFAREQISAGEPVVVKAGHIVTRAEAEILDRQLGDYSLQIAEDLFLCPRSKEEIPLTVAFLNHSCDPNVGLKGQMVFVTMRDLQAGEELTYDYAMSTTHEYSLACSCGTDKCRGTITGDDWKRPELRERYIDYFGQFILEKIAREKV